MQYIRETAIGEIQVNKQVIATIIADVVSRYRGKAYLSNKNGRLKPVSVFLGNSDENYGIEIEYTDRCLEIVVYLVIRFGVSIKYVAGSIINDICAEIKNALGEEPSDIRIMVTGTLSRNLVKRNICVTRECERIE